MVHVHPLRCVSLIGLALAWGLIRPAWANDRWVVEPSLTLSRGETLTYELLVTDRSLPGETLQMFLLRLAGPMRQWSAQSGMELCAPIGRDPSTGVYGVVLGTNRSHIGCTVVPDQVPSGMRATGESIHTHGNDRSVQLNHADQVLLGKAAVADHRLLRGRNLDHFSDTDRHGGPGYLVTPTGLLYQDGHGGPEELVSPTP